MQQRAQRLGQETAPTHKVGTARLRDDADALGGEARQKRVIPQRREGEPTARV